MLNRITYYTAWIGGLVGHLLALWMLRRGDVQRAILFNVIALIFIILARNMKESERFAALMQYFIMREKAGK